MTSSVAPSPDAGSAYDLWDPLVDRLSTAISDGLAVRSVRTSPTDLRNQIDRPAAGLADLAFPVHRHAKASGMAVDELARQLAESLPLPPEIARIEASGGFVNFHADPLWLVEATLRRALAPGGRFGLAEPSGRVVCVEHTSANPTGPFHIGRVRNAIIGDTFARILRAHGDSVRTQYYVDDVGRQAAMISWIWGRPPSSWPPEIRSAAPEATGPDYSAERPDLALGRPYPAVSAYLKTHAEAAAQVAEISRRLEAGESPPEHRRLAEAILTGMVASLGRIGISFDEFVWESTFLRDGSVEEVVRRLKAAPHAVVEENGAGAIDASSYGLPKESAHVIVTRADGTTLYATRDVAYHLQKLGRFQRVVDVLGQDHQLHARTLTTLLTEIGETRRPEFLIYQDITVPEGGRMSTRKGSVVYLDDLLDEAIDRARAEVRGRRTDLTEPELERIAQGVGTSAVRYHIARVAAEKTVAFRWEDALAFEGRSGPFLQYAYARASSILRKGGVADGPWTYEPSQLADPASLDHIRVLSRLPRTIAYAARTAHVHTVAGYAHDLAESFNQFYEKVPVLSSGPERSSRLALVAATSGALHRMLSILGLEALPTM